MTDLVFMDTETLGLDVFAPIWEFAALRQHKSGIESTLHIHIDHDPSRWLPDFPREFLEDYQKRFCVGFHAYAPETAALLISEFLHDRPVVFGAVPSFDTERITRQLLEPHGYENPWHYQVQDVETLVVGYLAGRGTLMQPPWNSDVLSMAVGVDPTKYARHTAMGDVLWAQAQWSAVMGGGR